MHAFFAVDLHDCPPQAGIHAVVALGGEARAEQVERVGCRGRAATAERAGDEGFRGLGEDVFADGGVQEEGGRAVGGELHGAVADVEQLGGDVALPEASDAFGAEDVAEGGERAFVDGPAAEVAVSERVGEGVGLELQADFDDVEGCDDEAVRGVDRLVTALV